MNLPKTMLPCKGKDARDVVWENAGGAAAETSGFHAFVNAPRRLNSDAWRFTGDGF
jgi:hypothetical protein